MIEHKPPPSPLAYQKTQPVPKQAMNINIDPINTSTIPIFPETLATKARMSGPGYYYHHLNANILEPYFEAQFHNFTMEDKCAQIKSLLTHARTKPDSRWENGSKNLWVE